jgi:putative transcriptional regulator
MADNFGDDLVESMKDMLAYADGKTEGARAHVIQVPDVRALRTKLHMSQQEFSQNYRIPLATLKGWEQGRRMPDATASAYLSVIAKLPDETRKAFTS